VRPVTGGVPPTYFRTYEGVAALLALYGQHASGLQSVKTIAWFKDGDLERLLDVDVRDTLTRAAATYDPRTPAHCEALGTARLKAPPPWASLRADLISRPGCGYMRC